MSNARNPVWEPDELVLALDLYFKHRPALPPSGSKHPDVIELSQFLNQLLLIPPEQRQTNFRNPSGVYMKLANFRWIDPDLSGGYSSVGQRDQEIWTKFAESPLRLHQAAEAIRRNAADSIAIRPNETDEFEFEVSEGRILARVHLARERNRAIVAKRKEQALREEGRLQCEVCAFDFRERYGEVGDGFIECHHTVPLALLNPRKKTKLSDLALVCANCHRMIHRSSPLKTVEEMRDILGIGIEQ